MAHILLLLDMANLWDSCRAQYGKRARVNFKVLFDKAKTKKGDVVTAVAFVANKPDKNQDNLVKKLNEFGIHTISKDVAENAVPDVSPEMLSVLRDVLDSDIECDSVVVGGGSENITAVLQTAVDAGKHTMVIGFCNGIVKQTAQLADDVRLLQKLDTITQ